MNFVVDRFENISNVYDLDKQIGKGAFGTVCRAKHTMQGTMRAVKSISSQKKSCSRVVDRFQREIECLKHLDHPGIVRVFETFREQKQIYVVMELCTGGELTSKIKDAKRFTEADAAITMQQMFRAVNYMHNSGIVHRDLKPDNFLLLHDGPIAHNVLKVVDFGFARDWRPGQVLTTQVGTPYYISPQVLDASYDNKSDIWSCGVIMYILLVGHPPFVGKTDLELFAAIRRAHLKFSKSAWKRISDDAIDLITQLLWFDPRYRYSAKQ